MFSKNTGNRPHTDPSSILTPAYLNFALFWQDITQLTISEKIWGIFRCRFHCSLGSCSNFLIHRKLMIIRWDSGNLSKSRLLTKFHQFFCNGLKETKCNRFLYVVKIRFHKVRPVWAPKVFFSIHLKIIAQESCRWCLCVTNSALLTLPMILIYL